MCKSRYQKHETCIVGVECRKPINTINGMEEKKRRTASYFQTNFLSPSFTKSRALSIKDHFCKPRNWESDRTLI